MDTDEGLTPGAQRILDVASELFYTRGIHAVGVDTVAAESGITKRTLYNRFGSKDALVTAYLRSRDRRWRDQIRSAVDNAGDDPRARALAPFDVLRDWLTPDSRGCSFVNAFAELPEPDHPGHQLIVAEKTWLRELFRRLLDEAGAPAADTLAIQLLSLHEGAIISHAIAGETAAAETARTAAEILATSTTSEEPRHPTGSSST